jgi:LytR cell envelope-related transcriptional attenuator
MSNEQPSRPPKRSGSGASPMGSTLAIVIAIAAVVVGFLILKNIRSDDDDAATPTVPSSTTVDPLTNTTPQQQFPVETQPTVFTPITTGANVLVANASHANGVAGTLTTALQGNQFTMGTPTNAATKEAVTKIQYLTGDTAAQQVAQSVAALMGVATVEPIPTPVNLADQTLLAGNTVLVLLGDDKAGKTLAQMVEPETTTDTAPADTGTTTAP